MHAGERLDKLTSCLAQLVILNVSILGEVPMPAISLEARRYESGRAHTQSLTQTTFCLYKTQQKVDAYTLISRAHSWETARRRSYLKQDLKKKKLSQKSCCTAVQHTTPRRLNSSVTISTYLFKAGTWPFQAHLFQQTLLMLLMTAHIHKSCKIGTPNNCW